MKLNVLILWRFSASKCFYFVPIFCETFLTANTTKIFQYTLEEYKVICPHGTPDHITKDGLEGSSDHSFVS